MSPASGPVQEPKVFPAATHDDQEDIMAGEAGEPTVLGVPPFSSPDPSTDGIKMLPLEEGTSAHQAALDAEDARNGNYEDMSAKDLKSLAESREVQVEGTGKNGNPTKADYVKALQANDTAGMGASDFIEQVKAATTQEELDAVADQYANSGNEWSTVESAIEDKQDELDNANDDA